MSVELKFYKADNSPWGFRLTGGADCDVPLTVIKVVEESIADVNGLKVGDVIVRINEYYVADYTHEEVHELISEVGQQLIFEVRRDYYSNDEDEDENNNLEVSDILGNAFEQIPHDQDSILNEKNNEKSSRLTDELIAEAISGEAEVLPEQNIIGVNFNKIDLTQSTVLKVMEQQKVEEAVKLQDRKWSSFLQKPQRPIVKPKSNNIEQPKAPPYQVIIKKQKKKNISFDTENILSEPEVEDDEEPEQGTNFVDQEADVEELENSEQLDNDVLSNKEYSDRENQSDDEHDEKSIADTDGHSENEISDDNELQEEVPMSVDEQLAQVHMQLQVLSQLPSSIQDTLESVTQQLTKILNATQLHTEAEQTLDSAHTSRGHSLERSLDEVLHTNEEVDYLAEEEHADEVDDEYHSNMTEISDKDFNYDLETKEQEVESDEEVYEPEIDEEELERLRVEAEKAIQQERNINVVEESHQRRLEQRPTNPLAPIQRPIILPGGRRWSQPNDAMPARRKKSSMSDEKIIETLDTYSETIVGHTKGINFLKYQPPAKNLDYLQKSEVYKLIHDMEPTPKGIATRPEIVTSEQDYYTMAK